MEIWWNKGNKCFSIHNNRKAWKENNIKPKVSFYTNGAKRKNKDKCLDVFLIIGYIIFNYTNFNLQGSDIK